MVYGLGVFLIANGTFPKLLSPPLQQSSKSSHAHCTNHQLIVNSLSSSFKDTMLSFTFPSFPAPTLSVCTRCYYLPLQPISTYKQCTSRCLPCPNVGLHQ
jgi:hypothetical protein